MEIGWTKVHCNYLIQDGEQLKNIFEYALQLIVSYFFLLSELIKPFTLQELYWKWVNK